MVGIACYRGSARQRRQCKGVAAAWQARRGELREHYHRAPRRFERPASLVKNRQSKEHEETQSESSSLSGAT